MKTDSLSRLVAGLVVSQVTDAPDGAVAVHFTDGAFLLVQRNGDGLAATFHKKSRIGTVADSRQPSARQREYLRFIMRYMSHFGISPAESDIQRHFMVAAPTVNQMVRTLERRGYITRARDSTGQAISRSIRVLVDSE